MAVEAEERASVGRERVEAVLKAAQERTGLADTGGDTWREGLALLTAEQRASPALSERTCEDLEGWYVDSLANRLKVIDHIARHPEILDERIAAPLVILGMPRTGTTVASYLLDEDPARRSLLNWEATDSVPPPTPETLRTDPRCLAKLEEQRAMVEMARQIGMPIPHWEWADGPTECIFVHAQDFKALYWDAFQPGTAYSDWLLQADMTSAYQYERKVLQLLQSRAPGAWSLKMPSHAVYIDTLLETFPDARLVLTHRDPFKVLGSLCATLATAKVQVMGDALDKALVGRIALQQLVAHLAPPLRARERIGANRFYDLHYAALVADPLAEMHRLYDWAGDTLTDEAERRMQRWLAENPQHKFGRMQYTLEEYGLSRDAVAPLFAEYIEAYGVALEGDA